MRKHSLTHHTEVEKVVEMLLEGMITKHLWISSENRWEVRGRVQTAVPS